MARKRMIHPEFFKSRKVASLSHRARLTWAGLWIYADDYGRGLDDRLMERERSSTSQETPS